MGRSREKRESRGGIGRSIRYLTHYKGYALLPYLFLVVATLAQLAVPKLIGNILDAVTQGYVATRCWRRWKIPAARRTGAARILSALEVPA
jgi:ATP-binding cassette subfamily B protein